MWNVLSSMGVRIVKKFSVSWFVFTGYFLMALWLVFLALYPDQRVRLYGLIATAVLLVLIAVFKRIYLTVMVTDDKLIISEGIIAKHTKEIFIQDIRAIDIRQNVLERIFNFGDVMIATSATAGYEVVLDNIGAPSRLKAEIEKRRQGD